MVVLQEIANKANVHCIYLKQAPKEFKKMNGNKFVKLS